jgi:TnpA family transposase
VPGKVGDHPALRSTIGGSLNIKHLRAHWDDVLRLAASIKHGTVNASLMLRNLGSYPRQNGLAIALRELARIERTLFILDWRQKVELRRRVHAGLNKGRRAMRWPGRHSFTGWARSATGRSSSSGTVPAG